jgi:hypothetical protein
MGRLRQMFTLLVRYPKAKSRRARKQHWATKKICPRCQIGRSAAIIQSTSDAIARPEMCRVSRCFRRGHGGRPGFHLPAQWQPHPHAGSFLQLAFGMDAAVISFHDGLGDGQPQAEAAGFARARAVAAPEALKNIGKVFRGNACAPIPHVDAGAVSSKLTHTSSRSSGSACTSSPASLDN